MFKAAIREALPTRMFEISKCFLDDERLVWLEEVYSAPACPANDWVIVIRWRECQKAELKAASATKFSVASRRRAAFAIKNRGNIAQKLWTNLRRTTWGGGHFWFGRGVSSQRDGRNRN
jgi:hypothetical protein